MTAEAHVVITNPTGLHARPAVKLAQLAAGFDAEVHVRIGDGGDWVRARSTARVMKLKAGAQSVLHVRAEGKEAHDAVGALVDFVRRDFDEGPAATHDVEPEIAPAADFEARAAGRETTTQRTGGRTLNADVASRGLAIGVLHALEASRHDPRPHGDPECERGALDAAVSRSVTQLRELAAGADDLAADLVAFQVSLLEDEEFLGPVWCDIGAGAPAETAWQRHLEREIADYDSAESSYLRDRCADLRDLGNRVAMALAGTKHNGSLPPGAIVISDELTPSRFLELDWENAAGIATTRGSTATHTAMLARARGVPFLVQVGVDGTPLPEGAQAVLDAERGRLVVEPSSDVIAAYERRIGEQREREALVLRHAAHPARTRGGTQVRVLLNVDEPGLLETVQASHCDGVGLTRTEFLFHARGGLPDEEVQLGFYRRLLEWAGERPVTVRTLDAGGDKPVPGLTLEGEGNPFLGLRGVRLSLARPEIFRIQLRALARAATLGELKVMIPMVSVPAELEAVRALMAEEISTLHRAGVAACMPALGMMVEVPAAALTIESFDAEFYSIGTNDLTSYLLAAARDSDAVAPLLDPLHAGVLELIKRVVDHGLAVGKEVSVCGEIAADASCLRALLDAGLRVLSVPPAALAATKAALASL